VLFAGFYTGVQGATIRIGSSNFTMFKVSGASFAANLNAQEQSKEVAVVEFDVTFTDGTTASISTAKKGGCFGGQWPFTTGSVCQAAWYDQPQPILKDWPILKKRNDIIPILQQLKFTKGIEVGVQKGRLALVTLRTWTLCKEYKLVDLQPGLFFRVMLFMKLKLDRL
jgi:hypothetical protein